MNIRSFTTLSGIATFASLAVLFLPALAARADGFTVSYLGPDVQTPAGITPNVETFDSAIYNGASFTTTFNNSGITGTYTGALSILPADQYGGAGGAGKYAAATGGNSYTLTLSSNVNYLGLWFSALDAGNNISFYNGSALVYSFTPDTFIQLVGACPTSAPSPNFCGNPNNGGDAAQQFAYLNFYDDSATFNTIVFTEATQGGNFESDNHAVALLDSDPGEGTAIPNNVTPEPATLLLLATGSLPALALLRRRGSSTHSGL